MENRTRIVEIDADAEYNYVTEELTDEDAAIVNADKSVTVSGDYGQLSAEVNIAFSASGPRNITGTYDPGGPTIFCDIRNKVTVTVEITVGPLSKTGSSSGSQGEETNIEVKPRYIEAL